VRGLLRRLFGVEPGRCTRMPVGNDHVTYTVELPERKVVVRTDSRLDRMAAVPANVARLRALGLPVPTVLAADHSGRDAPGAYVVLSHFPGRDLRHGLGRMTRAQITRVAEQVVGFQRRTATLPPGRGYGWVPIDAPGTFRSWTELIERDTAENVAGLARPHPPAVARLVDRLREARPYFDAVAPTAFLDDVTTKNVIVDGGELRGVVDFDVICYGDVLYWLGLTATAVRADCGVRAAFYPAELRRLMGVAAGSDADEALRLYTALFHVEFLPRCGPRTAARLVESLVELIA
jgi:aminoglycoside phosphotransferase (APT) family kinase protein